MQHRMPDFGGTGGRGVRSDGSGGGGSSVHCGLGWPERGCGGVGTAGADLVLAVGSLCGSG